MERIRAINIYKSYALYENKWDRIKEAFSPLRKKYHKKFEALKNITFNIDDKECVGIIGLNGSGKSTLLKILSGIITPNSGQIFVDGKISALLELGAGFNPEYTGIENIYLSSMIAGYTREETDRKLQNILDFADIGEFIHQPVKTYSSGMFVRLAFSVAINVDPDILIIDEALSVGDVFFQQKCYKKIKQLAQDSTVIIVSHDMNALTKFCNRIIVLSDGKMVFDGEPNEAISEYFKIKQGKTDEKQPLISKKAMNDLYLEPEQEAYSGKFDVKITKYYYSVNGTGFGEYSEKDDVINFKMIVNSKRQISNIIIGYQVRDKYGNEVFGQTNITKDEDNAPYNIEEGTSKISFSFRWPEIREGDYFITVGIGEGEHVLQQKEQCWLNNIIHLVNTTRGKTIFGLFNHDMDEFSISRCEIEE